MFVLYRGALVTLGVPVIASWHPVFSYWQLFLFNVSSKCAGIVKLIEEETSS